MDPPLIHTLLHNSLNIHLVVLLPSILPLILADLLLALLLNLPILHFNLHIIPLAHHTNHQLQLHHLLQFTSFKTIYSPSQQFLQVQDQITFPSL